MNEAYIVAGYMSSGNRAVAGILTAAGCAGNASTEQPQTIEELQSGHSHYVIIKHEQTRKWSRALQAIGYRVNVLIVVREPHATAASAVAIGHDHDYRESRERRLSYLTRTIATCVDEALRWELWTYKALEHAGARRKLLEWCGLDAASCERVLCLPGQMGPRVFRSQNAKHYVG